ncbi:MAG: hypothetical protein ACI9SP_002449 [Arenicella sp.]|jgi:hypothetical protein
MIKNIISLIRRPANFLNGIACWLEYKYSSADIQSKFVDLAPTDEADKTGVYSEAILFGTKNAKVSNIALTGPYGSGKSSIIQSFLKKYRRPALHISLAAFVPEAGSDGGDVSRQEIERSILQQMLFGADANKLPLSRFKRIRSPGFWSFFKSLCITVGTLALWYVFHRREDVISGTFFTPLAFSNGVNLAIFLLAAGFLWMTLHHFYVASFGLSLKSLSLKDVEIRPANDDQSSILNRHLDEIVYFFQSTNYDLVIIEDLDRFNNVEVFVTLREINSLVNENAGVKRHIRFLYALRDDMFVNTDRTKFFEFIIPVIPIINTSNSIDMVLEQEGRLNLDGGLNRQFLREVSRYLNDLRLIRNIFNEYAIYAANLETDGESLLDANKLLAILIYKNVYPRDFEQLHRGDGALAEILGLQGELIATGAAMHKAEIAKFEKWIEAAERQTPSDLRELRQIYAMAMIEMLPPNPNVVSSDRHQWVTLQQLASDNGFDQLIGAKSLLHRDIRGNQSQVDISKLESEVDSQKSYLQRKKEIENKAVENKVKILQQINELKSKVATLRTTKLNELLRLTANIEQDPFESFEENGELARFLLLEGHLDDTYYQYTSLFHSGRLSPNDNKFLIQIRAFIAPEPGFPIDNPKEVIAAMRDEDFRQGYVLNVKIVDSLLSEPSRYLGQTTKLFEFLSSEFDSCEDFFDAYYTSDRNVAELLVGLVNAWAGFVPAAIASPNNTSHITRIVASLTETSLKSLTRDFVELPEFVSENLPEILVNSPELAPERLTWLDFEVKDLAAIKEHSEIVPVMFEEGLFELTIANLEYIYRELLGKKDLERLRESNFTTIRSTNNAALLERIERDFDRYLCDVLLELPENSKEDEPTILAVICHDALDLDDLRAFLKQQTTLLSTLEAVPERLHAMLFELNVIEPTWTNCLDFMKGEGFEKDILVEYLSRNNVQAAILSHPIPSDSDSLRLRQFLIGENSFSDDVYRGYTHALPKQFPMPPEGLEPEKLQILINQGKITFSEKSLDALADNRDMQILFVAANINAYLSDSDGYALDEDFLEDILRSSIDNASKLRIVKLMHLEALIDLPDRAALIGPIIQIGGVKNLELNAYIVRSLVEHSRPINVQISLLNQFHADLEDDDVRQILAILPQPFSKIKNGYDQPKLKNTPENISLVKWLKSRKIISTWTDGGLFHNDIKVFLFRKP